MTPSRLRRTPRPAGRAPARITVDVALAGVRSPVSRRRIAALAEYTLRAERVRAAFVSIALVTAPAMARINARHLGHRGATDVITFALGSAPLVADAYLCPGVAARNARALGVPVRSELARLVVHAMLHATGWDHPDGDGRERSAMWRRQERLLQAWLRRGAA